MTPWLAGQKCYRGRKPFEPCRIWHPYSVGGGKMGLTESFLSFRRTGS